MMNLPAFILNVARPVGCSYIEKRRPVQLSSTASEPRADPWGLHCGEMIKLSVEHFPRYNPRCSGEGTIAQGYFAYFCISRLGLVGHEPMPRHCYASIWSLRVVC